MTLVDHLAGLPGISLSAYASTRRAVSGRFDGVAPDAASHARLHGTGPVVLVGGFCTTDLVLEPMRAWSEHLGYRVLTHTLNSGMACGTRSVEQVRATVRMPARLDEHGDGVHVVGYSTLGMPNLATTSCLVGPCCAAYRRRLREPLPVPFTSIYSKRDRLVPWRASIDEGALNVEVDGSHLDLVETGPARIAVGRALARHTSLTSVGG